MKIILIISLSFIAIFLIACGKENSAIEDFKKSKIGQEIAQCAGVSGVVDWRAFKDDLQLNDKIRVIEAKIIKMPSDWDRSSRSSNECSSQRDYEYGIKIGVKMAPLCSAPKKTLRVQWLYNLDTKQSELIYAGEGDNIATPFQMQLNIANTCK